MDFRPLNDTERRNLISALRGNADSNRAILMGRVIVGSCDDKVENDETGLANVRIVLQDGSYALTDKAGRWHLDNIRPGTHVVQLDLDSLPKDYEVVACENTMRGMKLGKSDMLSHVSYVPAGVVEIMQKQQQGWAYIRP